MSEIRKWPVVVAIDGSASSIQALAWAADEASRRHAALVIAHAGDVPHVGALTADTARSVLREVCDYGRELLADAIATVAETHPEVVTSTVLREQRAADLVAELSLGASVVVVGRGDHSAFGRLALGSNAERIATHSYGPVVVVSSSVPALTAPVVVGVSETENGKRALQAACIEAQIRGTEVIALRSWPELYWSAAKIGFGNSLADMEQSEQQILDDAVDAARREYPGIQIRGILSTQPPDVALSTIEGAGLLVVGCRRGIASHFSRLGPTTSWLLHHVDYPVMVVGEGKVVSAEETTETEETTDVEASSDIATTAVMA